MLAQNLVRCGLGALTYVDFADAPGKRRVAQNVRSRDEYQQKARALSDVLKQINPDVEVHWLIRDSRDIDKEFSSSQFDGTDLFICASDRFAVQAQGNIEAMRRYTPALFCGLYREGRAGELIFWVPRITPECSRCI